MPRRPVSQPGRVYAGEYKWLPALIVVMAAFMVWLYFGGKA